MSVDAERGHYLTAMTEAGLLVIHSLPITLSWIPHDVVNDAYNVGGTVTVGTFASINEAKQLAREQYALDAEEWQVSDALPFDIGLDTRTEIHTPDIDGHKLLRHGTRWKER